MKFTKARCQFTHLLIMLAGITISRAQTTGTATLTETLNGQTASVAFTLLPPTILTVAPAASSISTPAGKTVSFDLTMASACSTLRPVCQQPAGLQFQIQAPAAAVSAFAVTEGAVATAAAKSWSCAPQTVSGQTATKCILTGVNTSSLGNGVIAHVAVTIPLAASGSAPLTTSGFVAVNVSGNAMSGSIGAGPSLTLVPTLGLACAQTFIEPGEAVTCTASLSASSASSSAVSLATDKATPPGLAVPASVTIAANAVSQTFQVVGQ